MAKELKRLNTNMPVDLVARIDDYADRMCINRSSAINVLCNLALDSQQAVGTMSEMINMIKAEQSKSQIGTSTPNADLLGQMYIDKIPGLKVK